MFVSILLLSVHLTLAVTIPPRDDSHDHSLTIDKRLPGNWYHSPDHPVHALFKRADGDGTDYASIGSPAWSSAFPISTPDVASLPSAWVNALNAADAAGKIPHIPQASGGAPGAAPVYPQGIDPSSPQVCSATRCQDPSDIRDAPTGYFGTGFDDGPQPATTRLVQFLQQNNESATHFMIGMNVLYYPTQFQQAFDAGDDIAVHTWTHPYMTTLGNLDLLGQFGWSMQLIHNSTGGRVPRFWRPPYGDVDNRVRAIAKEVFGLTTIIWNQDTADWSLTSPGGTNLDQVHSLMTQWLNGPKTPGLVVLEHELFDQSVQAFIDAYPIIKSTGWKTLSVAQIVGNGSTYVNANTSSSTVTPAGILVNADPSLSAASNSSSTSSVSQISTTTAAAPSTKSSTPPHNGAVAVPHCNTFWTILVPLGSYLITTFSIFT